MQCDEACGSVIRLAVDKDFFVFVVIHGSHEFIQIGHGWVIPIHGNTVVDDVLRLDSFLLVGNPAFRFGGGEIDHNLNALFGKGRNLFGGWHSAAVEVVSQLEMVINFCKHYFTCATVPFVIFCRSSVFNSKMAFGVPAAAQMVLKGRKSSSR
jgi:hypothetical protein